MIRFKILTALVITLLCSQAARSFDGTILSSDSEDVRLVINSLPISYQSNSELTWKYVAENLDHSLSLLKSESEFVKARSIVSFDTQYLPAFRKAISGLPELTIRHQGKSYEIIYTSLTTVEKDNETESVLLEASGEIYYRMDEFEKAESKFKEALSKIRKENLSHRHRLLTALSKVHRRKFEFDKAANCLSETQPDDEFNSAIANEIRREAIDLSYDLGTQQKFQSNTTPTEISMITKPAFRNAKDVNNFAKKIASDHQENDSQLDAESKGMKVLILQRLPGALGQNALKQFLNSERFKELERQRELREVQRKKQLLTLLDQIFGWSRAKESAERRLCESQNYVKDEMQRDREFRSKQQTLEEQRLKNLQEQQSRESENESMRSWQEQNRRLTGTSYMSKYRN